MTIAIPIATAAAWSDLIGIRMMEGEHGRSLQGPAHLASYISTANSMCRLAFLQKVRDKDFQGCFASVHSCKIRHWPPSPH
jgi:hypothetical protein